MCIKKEIMRLYHVERMSVKRVAVAVNSNLYFVLNVLGNTRRTPKEAAELRKIRDHYGFIPDAYKGVIKWDD